MEGRKRTVQVKFYVTEEERRLIREKMKLIPTRNMAAYLRKMAIDGYVVHIDTTDIRAQTAELQKIGVNVNQIARRLNSMGPLYTQDVADIKGALAQIWQLQRYILSSQRCKRHWTTSRIRSRRMKKYWCPPLPAPTKPPTSNLNCCCHRPCRKATIWPTT